MTDGLDEDQACAALGVDRFGLAALIRSGDAPQAIDARFDAAAIQSAARARAQRRDDALTALAALDGPHLAPGDTDSGAFRPDLGRDDTEPARRPNNPPVLLIDACVLASAVRRHLVLALAEAGLIRLRWSPHILFETGHAHARIVADKPGRDGAGEAARLVTALEAAFPEALVAQSAVDAVVIGEPLPDPDDAHVIQAAVAGGATIILTENMKDFPRAPLKRLGVYARPTGAFIASLLGREPDIARAVLFRAARRLGLAPGRFALALERARLKSLAKKLGV